MNSIMIFFHISGMKTRHCISGCERKPWVLSLTDHL